MREIEFHAFSADYPVALMAKAKAFCLWKRKHTGVSRKGSLI